MKKTSQIITTVLFAGMIGLFGILHVALPDGAISETERRALASFPTFSAQSVFDGTFMKNLESYLPDQFPLRETFRTVKAVFEKASGRLDTGDVYEFDGHLAKLDYVLNENSVTKAGAKLEKIRNIFPAANAYLSVIPQKDYYIHTTTYPRLDTNHLISLLNENTPSYEKIDITGTLTLDSYYKTDSHWRQEWIFDTAELLMRCMGIPADVIDQGIYTQHEITDFYGVYTGQSALPVNSESILYHTSAGINSSTVTCVGAECDSIYTLSKLDDEKSVDMYDIFLGGAVPLVTIENADASTDRTLILVRDSFGSSIAPLFVDSYAKIYVVDLRYIASPVLTQFISADENTDLLVLLSTGILNQSEMLKVQ